MKPILLNQYSKIFIKNNAQLGFTLIELLLASFISIFVVLGAGYGLVTILDVNNSTEAKTQRQIELNRAMDYISEEVKMSKKVEWNSGLKLTFPNDTTVTYSAAATTSNSIWLKDYTVKKDSDDTLVDALVAPVSAEVTSITNECTGKSGTFSGNYGFYACIYSDNRRVDLYLYGKTGSKSTDYVKVKTTAFARAK
jgi:type II secretory pathway pseudopilin PulG